MPEITDEMKKDVEEIVYDFFSDECEVELSEINDNTDIIRDLGGDSLMFLELLTIFKKKYDLDIELKSVGKYVVKHPTDTIREVVDMTQSIILHGNAISDFD